MVLQEDREKKNTLNFKDNTQNTQKALKNRIYFKNMFTTCTLFDLVRQVSSRSIALKLM